MHAHTHQKHTHFLQAVDKRPLYPTLYASTSLTNNPLAPCPHPRTAQQDHQSLSTGSNTSPTDAFSHQTQESHYYARHSQHKSSMEIKAQQKKKNKRTKNCEQQQNCLSTSVYEFFKQKVWKVCPYPPLLFLLLKTPAHWLSVVRCWYIQLLHCNTISQPFDIIFYGSHWEQNFTDTPCSWLYCLQNNWPPLSLWQQAKKNKKYMYIYIYMF